MKANDKDAREYIVINVKNIPQPIQIIKAKDNIFLLLYLFNN